MGSVPLSNGSPTEGYSTSTNGGKKQMASSSSSSSSTTTQFSSFQVTSTQTDVNGKCVSTVTIDGNGIHKEIQSGCEGGPTSIINQDGKLLVGNEWYSDTAGVLVHVSGGKCTEEIFQDIGGKQTSEVQPMDTKDCDAVKTKIDAMQKEQKKQEQLFREQMEKLTKPLSGLPLNLFGANFFGN